MDFTTLSVDALLYAPTALDLKIPRPGPVRNVLRVVVCWSDEENMISALVLIQSMCSSEMVRVSRNYDRAVYASFCYDHLANKLVGHAFIWGQYLVGFIRVRSMSLMHPFSTIYVEKII
jgi:tetrahydromethanopterin S-methyltransferase subunit E